jgi:hypothetical protein
MSTTSYTIRDDERYTVIVGWEDELETFYAYVFDGSRRDGEPVLALGQEPREVPTVSQLVGIVGRVADLDFDTVSTLRRDARRDASPLA